MRLLFPALGIMSLLACVSPGTEAVIEGVSRSCTISQGINGQGQSNRTQFSAGVVDDGVEADAVLRIPPGTEGHELFVEFYFEDNQTPDPSDQQTVTTDEKGLLPLPLSWFPMGTTGISVRKKANGKVFKEGTFRRVPAGEPRILCGGIVTTSGTTQSVPTDGTIRVLTNEAEGLEMTLYVGNVDRSNPFNPQQHQTFSGTTTVSSDVAEFPAPTTGYSDQGVSFAVLMNGDQEIDRLDHLTLASPDDD